MVPGIWPRLTTAAVLNVTGWMVLMGLALLWLPASEAALIAYTMPVWASLIAWPVLGERPTVLRTLGLVMAFVGPGLDHGRQRHCGECGEAAGHHHGAGRRARLCRRHGVLEEVPDPPAADHGRGLADRDRLPADLDHRPAGRDHASFAVTPVGWWLLVYSTVVQFCIAYVSWFAALARLPASVAAIGTMAVPVIGVVASALALGEPLGPGQIAALIFTLAAVVLATR